MALDMVRHEPQGLLVAGHGLRQPLLVLEDDSQIEMSQAVIWLETQSLPNAGSRLIQLALLLQCGSEVVVGLGQGSA